MALRGLLYCAAILIQTILVDSNVEIRFGAEKSMVRSDCRVVFFHRFRSGERYLSAALEAPHGLPCGTIAVNLDDSDGVLRVRNAFTHLFPKLLSDIHGVHRDRAAEAFSLSDAFIQRSERFNNLQQITNLQYNMVLDFADRMSRIRQGEKPTQLTISVSNYVRRHISEKISVEDIAKELFMSRPYLSAKFSHEAGMSLTDFILKQKTEEAKRLLRYSDKSAAAISSYLGFSSQSHFSRVFRKYSGKTPAEYRDKYQR